MGLIDSIFGRDDEGCGEHHFGDWEETGDRATDERIFAFDREGNPMRHEIYYSDEDEVPKNYVGVQTVVILKIMERICKHTYCSATETDEEVYRVIPYENSTEPLTLDEFKDRYPTNEEDE